LLRRGWKPVLATAASVTLVVSLATQLLPLHEQQWTDDSVQSTNLIAPQKETSADAPQPVAAAPEVVFAKPTAQATTMADEEALATQEAKAESQIASEKAAEKSSTSAVLEAHMSADRARQKRLEASKKQRLNEQRRLLEPLQSQLTAPTDEQIIEQLERILSLLDQGDKAMAEVLWLKLQSQVASPPESDSVSLIWKKVAKSFE
jgi:hypothetical protein